MRIFFFILLVSCGINPNTPATGSMLGQMIIPPEQENPTIILALNDFAHEMSIRGVAVNLDTIEVKIVPDKSMGEFGGEEYTIEGIHHINLIPNWTRHLLYHELGHALGLSHATETWSLMYPDTNLSISTVTEKQFDDIAERIILKQNHQSNGFLNSSQIITTPQFFAGFKTYSFLFNSPKFPRLLDLDNKILLQFTAIVEGQRIGMQMNTTDGVNWSEPIRIPFMRHALAYLGGGKIIAYGGVDWWLSEDSGETWKQSGLLPTGYYTDISYTGLVEGKFLKAIFFRDFGDQSAGSIFSQASILNYSIEKNEWNIEYTFDSALGLNEGSLSRDENGLLVAVFRTIQIGVPMLNDSEMGMTTITSKDGKHWSTPIVHSLSGEVHDNLIRLKNGKLLLTYARRLGLDRGIHTMIWSGKDWKYEAYIAPIDNESAHSPSSVELKNGQILSVFMQDVQNSYEIGKDEVSIGEVRGVIK